MKTILVAAVVLAAACGGAETSDSEANASQDCIVGSGPACTIAYGNFCEVAIGGATGAPGTCLVLNTDIHGFRHCSCAMGESSMQVTFDGRTNAPAIARVWPYGPFAGYTATATQLSPTTFEVTWAKPDGSPVTSAASMVLSDWQIVTTAPGSP